MKIEMAKRDGMLVPVDEAGEDALRAIKSGKLVMVDVKQPRHLPHHRKAFALLRKVYPNTDFPTEYALLKAIQVYLGYCDMLQTKGGKTVPVPHSISFESMDQTAFNKLYDEMVQAIVTHFIPGLAESDLRREVEELCGARAA